MTQPIFPSWQPSDTEAWGKRPMRFAHTLHQSPLFSDDALASLISRYPKGAYGLINTAGQHERRLWREGDIGGVPGAKVIEAIGKGRMWLNLRNASGIDPAYGALLEQMFAEFRSHLPGFDPIWSSMGILISSPGARVFYHADMPGQALGQIRGRKTVYVYPAASPYLTPQGLENIALSGHELSLEYKPEFDSAATVFEAEPGQMFHWPLNAPHRVDNHDMLNVSITLEFLTPAIKRHQVVTAANGILRQKLGVSGLSARTDSAAYWPKAVLQGVVRRAERYAKPAAKKRPPTFTLDLTAPGFMRDIPAQNQP